MIVLDRTRLTAGSHFLFLICQKISHPWLFFDIAIRKRGFQIAPIFDGHRPSKMAVHPCTARPVEDGGTSLYRTRPVENQGYPSGCHWLSNKTIPGFSTCACRIVGIFTNLACLVTYVRWSRGRSLISGEQPREPVVSPFADLFFMFYRGNSPN